MIRGAKGRPCAGPQNTAAAAAGGRAAGKRVRGTAVHHLAAPAVDRYRRVVWPVAR